MQFTNKRTGTTYHCALCTLFHGNSHISLVGYDSNSIEKLSRIYNHFLSKFSNFTILKKLRIVRVRNKIYSEQNKQNSINRKHLKFIEHLKIFLIILTFKMFFIDVLG